MALYPETDYLLFLNLNVSAKIMQTGKIKKKVQWIILKKI